jgi:hypothetical protein
MSALLEPATIDLIWTLCTGGVLMGISALALYALPWTDREIAKIDAQFRSVGEISHEGVPVRTMG